MRGFLATLPLAAVIAGPLALLAGATPAMAQPREFNCIGAERLEDDVFAIGFRAGRATLSDAARTPLAAAADLAKNPGRNLCVLGFAAGEGGQTSSTRLAAQRARAVSEALSSEFGIERDRIRAEARNPGFARNTANREQRSVIIVVLPAPPGAPPAPPTAEAPSAPAVQPARPATPPPPAAPPEGRPAPRPAPGSSSPPPPVTPPGGTIQPVVPSPMPPGTTPSLQQPTPLPTPPTVEPAAPPPGAPRP
ncbi:OmpA family protein [Acetobacteraceae bacterium H6797]|nr:OmpA family protein [Acetobacteraceae bacterium H6797]